MWLSSLSAAFANWRADSICLGGIEMVEEKSLVLLVLISRSKIATDILLAIQK